MQGVNCVASGERAAINEVRLDRAPEEPGRDHRRGFRCGAEIGTALGLLQCRREPARQVRDLLPNSATLPDLLLTAILSAVSANLVNSIPATLIPLPVVVGLGTGPVPATLVGVNAGPRLTTIGVWLAVALGL